MTTSTQPATQCCMCASSDISPDGKTIIHFSIITPLKFSTTMERYCIIILLALAATYGGLWLFNHVNAWIGIAVISGTAYAVIKIFLLTLKNKNNEK